MAVRDFEERVFQGTRDAVARAGVVLLDIEAVPGSVTRLRFFIDAEGGVKIEDCVRVDRLLTLFLTQEDEELIPGDFSVEVSSPGLDRVLRRREEYTHFAGREIQLFTGNPEDGVREYRGILDGLEEEEVLLRTPDESLRIPIEEVTKARLTFDLGGATSGRGS